MLRHMLMAAMTLSVGPALAGDWAMNPDDVALSRADIAEFLATQDERSCDGGRSEYGPDWRYAYIYSNEDRAEGRFRIEADGSVCVDFANCFSRCDLFGRNCVRVLLIDEKGDRYPLKPSG